MSEKPHTTIHPPHAPVTFKAAELDCDRTIALTDPIASYFADMLNQRLNKPDAKELLRDGRRELLAEAITHESLFPFRAAVTNGRLVLTPALGKLGTPVLKDISDGVTEVNKRLAKDASLGEHAKFAIALLFQPAIYGTYHAAGMHEGAHTKYTTRSC